MRNSNNKKKGFTLIELLAVIVVLAIVMVLATSTVLPMIAGARKSAFATEANSVLDAAKNSVSLLKLGQSNITSNCTSANGCLYDNNAGKYCFTLQGLYKLGMLEKELGSDYGGTVLVTAPTSGNATYEISMYSPSHYVSKQASSVKDSDVTESATHSSIKIKCTGSGSTIAAST